MNAFLSNAGVVLAALGGVLLWGTTGNLYPQWKLRRLQRHGIEGEAESVLEEGIRGGPRITYVIRLPDGEAVARFMETGVPSRGPVGTVVPVMYDRHKPSRARTGTLADIDPTEDGLYLRFFWGTGLALIAVGVVLGLVFG
ncbi:DUF3592 domain-containing protein [Streptomyces sp. NPDC006393]|uniref:DUF3592 domain-containing protein n=1 Tax=Streptomyces sp. NPDC006393 TaxID=3156763 RepID=UPI00340ABE1F